MPELPEVEIVKRSLYKMVNKAKFIKIKILNRNLRYKIDSSFQKQLINEEPCCSNVNCGEDNCFYSSIPSSCSSEQKSWIINEGNHCTEDGTEDALGAAMAGLVNKCCNYSNTVGVCQQNAPSSDLSGQEDYAMAKLGSKIFEQVIDLI